MKLSEKKEREYIIKIISSILETNISIMYMYRETAIDEKSRNICNKSIRQCRKGLKVLNTINHIEILRSLFSKVVYGKEVYFATVGSMCATDKISFWDTTEKGFQEFTKLEEEAKELTEKELEEKRKQQELIKKAQDDGKKVDWVYDKDTKKLKPVVVEEKPNA